MIVKIGYSCKHIPEDDYSHIITSEDIGKDYDTITGRGSTESEALCEFENNAIHFFNSVFKMMGIDEEVELESIKIE